MLFSVIIPAYNSSATIHRCLNSVYSLPVGESEFEVILIDDCSKDETVPLVRRYAETHSNLFVIQQSENHRQGAARNLGLSVSKGKYVVFLDSDDELSRGILASIDMAEKLVLNMVAFKGEKLGFNAQFESSYELPYSASEVFSGIRLQTEHPFWCTGPVLYVYNKEFLNTVNYPFAEDVLYEDSDFVSVHLFQAGKMGYCNECGYIIHSNPSSTTHTISSRHICDYALLGTRMLRFYDQMNEKNTTYADSVLEGGSWNIMQSCKQLFKLKSKTDVRSFYDRFDSFVNRKALLHYQEPAYCWTPWTRFCLRRRDLTVFFVGLAISIGVFKHK